MHSWAPRKRKKKLPWLELEKLFGSLFIITAQPLVPNFHVSESGNGVLVNVLARPDFSTIRNRIRCTCAGWQIEYGSILKSMNYRTMRKVAESPHRFRLPSGARRQKLNKTRNGKSIPSAFNKKRLMWKMETKARQVWDAREKRSTDSSGGNARSVLKGKKYVFKGSRSVQKCSRQ